MRPPFINAASVRRALPVFLAVVVGLAISQVVLTRRLMEQESNLVARQSREHLEQVADLTISQLTSSLEKWELALRQLQTLPPPNDLPLKLSGQQSLILMADNSVNTFPVRPLLFAPATTDGEPSVGFQEIERLEFRNYQYQHAINALRGYASDGPGPTRAEALLRLARLEKKLNHFSQAVQYYSLLSSETDLNPDGVPYALLAQGARCEMLPDKNCAAQLRSALLAGRWRVRRETFEFYWAELNRWQRSSDEPPKEPFAFAVLVKRLYDRWRQLGGVEGGVTRELGDDGSLIICHATPSRLAVLITPHWQNIALQSPASAREIRWRWIPNEPEASATSLSVTRSLGESGLTGRLEFSSAAAANVQTFKQSLWLAAVALMLIVVLAGAYAIHRGVSRELKVSQLQADFVAAVSHEFRSPLTSLRGLTEMLSDGRLAEPSQLQRSFTFLQRETARLQRLVEDLLDFGSMESRRKPYDKGLHNAFSLVRQAVEDYQDEACGRGFNIEVDLEARNAKIQADQDALKTALRNLLENAVKYSPECHTVWVEGRVVRRKVAISIRDRGMGVSPGERRAIFEKFVRGESAKTAGIKGTGLGLAMVLQIVEANGGDIQLESSPGQGSTFTILLPLAAETEKKV